MKDNADSSSSLRVGEYVVASSLSNNATPCSTGNAHYRFKSTVAILTQHATPTISTMLFKFLHNFRY